jgi:multifunctional methyltransferase subunit TRM112
MTRILPRLEWPVIKAVADTVGLGQDLPSELDETLTRNTEFLQKLHHVLLEIDIVEGQLECPETGRKFPINQGIPNMLLNEDEV